MGKTQKKIVKNYKINNYIHEKAYRNKPLTENKKSKTKRNQKPEQEKNMYLVLWNKV